MNICLVCGSSEDMTGKPSFRQNTEHLCFCDTSWANPSPRPYKYENHINNPHQGSDTEFCTYIRTYMNITYIHFLCIQTIHIRTSPCRGLALSSIDHLRCGHSDGMREESKLIPLLFFELQTRPIISTTVCCERAACCLGLHKWRERNGHLCLICNMDSQFHISMVNVLAYVYHE